MARGMGSSSVWMSAALVLATGCGASAANQNRGRVSNPNAVATSVAPRGEILLRYAPTPGLTLQRTTRLLATMEGRRLEMETVMRVTLEPEPAGQCVRASISLDGQLIELPCDQAGAPSQLLTMVHRLDALASLAIIEYPDRPVRVGDSWPCRAAEGDSCRWTLTGIEDSPAGLVALLHADGMGSVEGQSMQGQMTFTARVSDGVMLRGEVDAQMPGQLSFHVSISATEARPTN